MRSMMAKSLGVGRNLEAATSVSFCPILDHNVKHPQSTPQPLVLLIGHRLKLLMLQQARLEIFWWPKGGRHDASSGKLSSIQQVHSSASITTSMPIPSALSCTKSLPNLIAVDIVSATTRHIAQTPARGPSPSTTHHRLVIRISHNPSRK
jgi:hypothetical protein